jgi:hypothetical protein
MYFRGVIVTAESFGGVNDTTEILNNFRETKSSLKGKSRKYITLEDMPYHYFKQKN